MMLAGESHHEQLFSTPELRRRILKKIRTWIESSESAKDKQSGLNFHLNRCLSLLLSHKITKNLQPYVITIVIDI